MALGLHHRRGATSCALSSHSLAHAVRLVPALNGTDHRSTTAMRFQPLEVYRASQMPLACPCTVSLPLDISSYLLLMADTRSRQPQLESGRQPYQDVQE